MYGVWVDRVWVIFLKQIWYLLEWFYCFSIVRRFVSVERSVSDQTALNDLTGFPSSGLKAWHPSAFIFFEIFHLGSTLFFYAIEKNSRKVSFDHTEIWLSSENISIAFSATEIDTCEKANFVFNLNQSAWKLRIKQEPCKFWCNQRCEHFFLYSGICFFTFSENIFPKRFIENNAPMKHVFVSYF